MNRPPYVELRTRSAFSFLEGATAPEDLATTAHALGYDAIALGDRDGLYGAPRFYHAASEAKLKAIVGADLPLDSASFGLPSGISSRLYVLVPDQERYRNLCRMLTAAKLRPLGTHPNGSPRYPAKGDSRVTLADLERYGNGLIALAGGALSPLTRMLIRGGNPLPLTDRLGAILGRNNLLIDLQRHLDPDEERLNRRLLDLAAAAHLPLVATNDVCFTLGANGTPRTVSASPEMHTCIPTDAIRLDGSRTATKPGPSGARWQPGDDMERALLDVMTCIRLGLTLEEAGRALWANHERHLKSPTAMAALFRDQPRALAMTREVADRCTFTLKDLGYRFPDYPLPPGETPDSYLRALTWAGARSRWREPDARVHRQLEYELDVIARLKLAGYFLIVWDIVEFCRENNILAQGRGSAANSAVCYALGITAVDAVKMELLFERFLSEERGEWPDIDIDLPSGDQREKAIQYVYRRYGERGAAMTANVITYRIRSAVRETAKVLGFPPDQIDRLARLSYVYEFRDQDDEFTSLLRKGGVDPDAPRMRILIELIKRFQGLPRHLGQHSGGMVIGGGPLDEIVPLEPASMPGRVVIQWDKEDCADLGIIKIDLLGLGMLAVLEQAIPMIRRHEGVAIDLAHLPADDPAVYAMMQKADTVGVFQIESRAQMATLPRMKPTTFYDLVVEVAIIRPGPIVGRMVHPYLDRRRGHKEVRYDHPALEPILKRTLGVPLFQEQLLRMAMVVAGFSGGEAEELRRAMGFKRSAARMQQIETRLREGMARKGISGAIADRIARSITSFALYGFPESHAASFALIAYASAYLKCHHPAAFYAAMLNCYPLGFYHPATLVKDAQHHRVTVLPIDVTQSDWACTIAIVSRQSSGSIPAAPSPAIDHQLRLGLKYVAGLRAETGQRIETARAQAAFKSIADFTARVAPNRRELEMLAWAGAFAQFHPTRRDAMWQAAAVERDPASLLAGAEPSASDSTESAPTHDASSPGLQLPRMTPIEETFADFAATGLTAGPHVMAHVRARLRATGILSAADLAEASNHAWVKVAGVVIVRQRPGTAKGFLFITLEDETGIANVIVTPDNFQANRTLLHRATVLIAEGPLQKQQGVIHVRGHNFRELKLSGAVTRSHDFH
ncbi:MAG TPA: error-prone DNA polymerase [Candidatus Binataceae bacterium]|nr:error-prone DNA polymerase [Candidatus Binataceae bacterium]